MKNVGEKRMDKNKKDAILYQDAATKSILYQVRDTDDGCFDYLYVSTYNKKIATTVFKNVKQAQGKFQHVKLEETYIDEVVPELTWIFFESNDVELELSSVCVEGADSDFNIAWHTDPGRCWKIQATTRKKAERKLKQQYGVVLTTPKEE